MPEVGAPGAGDLDLDSQPIGMMDSSGSSSDPNSESETEIPIPRSCRQHPIQLIQGGYEVAEDDQPP